VKPHRLIGLAFVLVPLAAGRAAEPDPELIHAEKTLKEADVQTDGPGLLRFVGARTLTDADRARLPEAVRHLGDEDFDTREKAATELLRAGRKALPFLRPAQDDKDPERARRAALCVKEIEGGADLARITAAVRLLADRRPEGTAAALLAYLPGADDEFTEEAVLRSLLAVAVRDGKPEAVLVEALSDREPLRRAAAAHVVGRCVPDQRSAVRRLLADGDARVRFEAAEALVRAGEKDAVPVLIALVGKGPMPLGHRAQDVLFRLAGDKAPRASLSEEGPPRDGVADLWRAWWKEAGPATDLTKINLDEALHGINVLGEQSRVWACRADGKQLWEIGVGAGPVDVQLLANGNVLLAEWSTKQITERDREGKVVWTKNVDNYPTTCKRLPSGNTFIATYGQITEVDPKGTPVYTRSNPNGLIFRAHRLPNGHVLYAGQGDKLVEIDAAGQEVRTVKVPVSTSGWTSVEPLPGNRFLVAVMSANQVFEIDGTGKVLWECKVMSPMSAVRLPNGNTLVGCRDARTVVEFDRAGKEVWRLQREQLVFCARRY
jgi:outer membrane protein assembly factor BamB